MKSLLTFLIMFITPISSSYAGAEIHGGSVDNQVTNVRKFSIPGYPPLARQAQIQGQVSASVHIRPDGIVDSLSNVQGPPLLSSYVSDVLKSWEFILSSNQATDLK